MESPSKLSVPDSQPVGGLSAVDRTMFILESLSATPGGLSITELSARLRINKALVHRILASLVVGGYVQKDEQSDLYHLTSKMVELAFRRIQIMDIYDLLLPVLRRLARNTGELAEINWLENNRLVTVAKADSPRRVKVVDFLGEEQSMHASSSGKVYLASLPPERVREILHVHGMPMYTANTITDIETMTVELDRVRAQGYAVNNMELGDEVISMSAPVSIHGFQKPVRGAVSLAAPAYRKIHIDQRATALMIEAGREIAAIWPHDSLE